MSNVTHIRGGQMTLADAMPLPQDLRELADEIERGERPATRALFLYEAPNKTIKHVSLGQPITLLEAVGMLAWCVDQVKEEGYD